MVLGITKLGVTGQASHNCDLVARFEFAPPPLLSDEEIEDILSKLDDLTKWASEIQAYAQDAAVNHGKVWRGFKLVESRTNRKYTDEEAVAQAAKDAGYTDIFKKSLITLTEMERLMGKKNFKAILRKLKEHKVECYFEKENIWTFDGKGELLLTIMSSLAQEESRSISENCTWGQRKRFSDGKFSVAFSNFLGYDRGENGELVLNEEQAAIVRRIYGLFLQGRSPYAIAKLLTSEGIPTPSGKEKWCGATVKSILQNEKYKGDALLQKRYTVDFLTKKKKVNKGEVPQYYVEGSHDAIIAPSVFDAVQKQMAIRHPGKNRHSCVSIFSGKIKCGDCGSWYGSKVWHSNDKYRRVIWQCNHKFDGGEKCTTPHLDEEKIKELFLKAVNFLPGN